MLGPDRPLFNRPPAAPNSKTLPAGTEQVIAVRQFVAQVGGIENARRALEMLKLLKRAA